MRNLLYFDVITFRNMWPVPSKAVLFNPFMSCFRGTLFRQFLNDFEISPVDDVITDIAFAFTYHTRCIFIVRSIYSHTSNCFRFFSIIFQSSEIALSINIRRSIFITMSTLLHWNVLSVFNFKCYHHHNRHRHNLHHHHNHHLYQTLTFE